ncbi:sensor histidine kinase [Emcibacter nanhaiensis]|uniref:Sensor histidine kinase n=1 Tax=Emcibacter nanhaiensis TaxID=1505037 RepID=A0A501PQC5_9PROT|nr:histidine kinase [Emcibacter nanhaiensis]TPD62653.1 sensor histidine kinase [Emcibacter nanhaiensis]
MKTKLRNIIQYKESIFWLLQVTGWIAFCAIRTLNGYAHGRDPEYFYATLFGTLGGFIITLGLRYIYQKLRQVSPPPVTMLLSVTTAVVIGSLIFSTVEVWTYVQTYEPDWNPRGWEFLSNALYDVFVLLTWTGLYFIINNQIELQEQREKYLQAMAQAHQAQLKMLRYQLNPHFLFNTLNAISTLVLDKQTKEANNMLSKLSAFLRFSLVSQPMQKMTVDEELYALWLYLDIEKVRFQDRLELDFEVSEQAKLAMIPSLLLQPLVENAIKYAIAPLEDGGRITLRATVEDDKLVIVLSDNGPGLAVHKEIPMTSSGVGIANTRNRLEQLYPDDHELTIGSNSPKGLKITIKIPYEVKEEKLPEVAE